MSSLDLRELLGGTGSVPGSEARNIPASSSFKQPPIHAREAVENMREIAQAAMDTIGEIIRNGRDTGGFGKTDAPMLLIGPYPVGIGPDAKPIETEVVSSTQNIDKYELIFPIHADIRESDRFAVPGFFFQWRSGQAYSVGDKTTSTQLNSGKGPFFICVRAGLSGGVEPVFEPLPGTVVTDGDPETGAIWQWAGEVTYYEITGVAAPYSNMSRLTVKAQVIR